MPKSAGRLSKRAVIVGGAATALVAVDAVRAAAPAGSSGVFDHTAFDSLLARYARRGADGVVRVDYCAWRASGPDRNKLHGYVGALAAADPEGLLRPEQFAFWANLYNALTLDVVLSAFPVTSIRQIKPNFLALGPWKQILVRVRGVDLSLDAIENDILRKRWRDPRVHYAINCASISCPNLPLRAWRGGDLAAGLDGAAHAYVNHPRAVRFDGAALVVSSIYKWYAADFGGADAKVIRHLASYAAEPLRQKLEATARISRDNYDWSLNGLPGPA